MEPVSRQLIKESLRLLASIGSNWLVQPPQAEEPRQTCPAITDLPLACERIANSCIGQADIDKVLRDLRGDLKVAAFVLALTAFICGLVVGRFTATASIPASRPSKGKGKIVRHGS